LEVDLGSLAFTRVDEIPEVKGKRILIIGGGEAALDQALLAHRRGAAQVSVGIRGLQRVPWNVLNVVR